MQTACSSFLNPQNGGLERGKAYPVTLIAGSRSIQVKAAAEPKGVSVLLTDRPLNERMRTANFLEVVGEGATLRVPLDGSTAALARLEACFEKNSRQNSDTNPFVAPNRMRSIVSGSHARPGRNGRIVMEQLRAECALLNSTISVD
jgi:hypothetical protein